MAKGSADISRLIAPIAIAIGALAVGGGAYVFLLAPKISILGEGGRYDLDALKAEITDDQAYAARIEEAVEAHRTLNSQIRQKVQAIVPTEVDEPGIMAAIDAIARAHAMVLKSIDVTPIGDEIGEAGQTTVRVSMNIEGGDYEEFKLLLADLERSQRLFDVRSIVFTPMTGQYSLQLKAYQLPRTGAAPAAAPRP